MGGLFFLTDFSAWSHHAFVTITGSTDGDKTNCRVTITLSYQSFMNVDFGDVRFALSDGTELKYCIQSYTASNTATFIVLIPSLPASPTMTKIVIYAGNSAVTTTSDPQTVLNSPAAFYPLDENSGSVIYDRSGNAKNGTLYNNPSTTTGRFGTVITWNGSNQYASIPVIVTGDWTICFWIKTTQNAYSNGNWYQSAGLVDGEVSGITNDYGIGFGARTVVYGVGNPDITIHSNPLNDGNYHFVTATRNSTTGVFTLYIDGTQVATANGGTGPRNAMNQLLIARESGSNNYYSGTIERILFYNSVKSISDLPYCANEPTVGTIGEWAANGLVISTPPIQSILTIITPQIALGGGVRITAPPIGLTSSINIPISRAIISSPPITAVSSIIPPVIAFLMEVKAGVTYNPDAIDDLRRDGLPVKISFNLMVGGEKYE